MIRKLLQKILGKSYIEKKHFDQAMNSKNYLITENQRLNAELLGAKEVQKRVVRVIAADIGDIEPVDEKKRKEFVAAASNFYQEILEKKLMQMIAQIREELDTEFVGAIPLGMNRTSYDNFLRGTSNAFRLLMDWGDQMKGEHLSNITKPTE